MGGHIVVTIRRSCPLKLEYFNFQRTERRIESEERTVLYHVTLDVHIPHDLPAQAVAELKTAEKQRVLDLQKSGHWLHLWRVAGQFSSISILDVADHDELHDILSSLPLFPYMRVEVMALARHPSALA